MSKWLKKIKLKNYSSRLRKILLPKSRKIQLKRPDIHRWDRRIQSIFQITWRLSLLILILGLFWFLYKSTQDESYSIKAFHVPENFEDAGYNGLVVAQKIMDELAEVNAFINSQKEEKTDIHTDLQPDLNVQVMGIGLTLNSFTYHLRKILGKENRAIGGELTDIDHQLKLTVRVSSQKPVTVAINYKDGGREAALIELFHEGAKDITGKMDPYRMAVYHYKKEEYEASMEYIMRVLNERPEERHWAYLAWSGWLNRQNRLDESIEKLNKALEVKEDFKLAMTNLGWRYYANKDYDNAMKVFDRIHKLEPSNVSAWNGKAWCHRILGEVEKADQCYAMAVEKEPESIWLYGNWADFRYWAMRDTVGAIQIYEKARKSLPESAELYLSTASTYAYRDDIDSTLLFAQKAYDIDPHNFMTLQMLNKIHYEQEAYLESEEFSRKCIRVLEGKRYQDLEVRPYQLQQAYNRLAMCKYQTMQYDSALHYVNIAIDLFPRIGYPYSTLAETYAYMGEHEKFYEAVEKGVQYGFDFSKITLNEPYDRYVDDPRFQQLIKKDQEIAMKN